jgi:hypothetical protein
LELIKWSSLQKSVTKFMPKGSLVQGNLDIGQGKNIKNVKNEVKWYKNKMMNRILGIKNMSFEKFVILS